MSSADRDAGNLLYLDSTVRNVSVMERLFHGTSISSLPMYGSDAVAHWEFEFAACAVPSYLLNATILLRGLHCAVCEIDFPNRYQIDDVVRNFEGV